MVDLIPEEFRRAVRLRRLLRRFAFACLGIAAGFALARAGLLHALQEERAVLARFKQMQAQARAQQARLAELTARRTAAEKQLAALDALRGDATMSSLFEALQGALGASAAAASGERVWFQELAFFRGGDPAEQKAEASSPGYFVLAGKDRRAESKGDDEGWRSRERAEIRGVSIDHPALSTFIRGLGEQAGVKQVRLLDTSTRSYPGLDVVNFQLAAVLGAAGRAGP